MKILLINQEHAQFGGPGGAERSVQGLAEQYADLGHDVTFLTTLRSTYTRDVTTSGIHTIKQINGVRTVLLARKGNGESYADLILQVVLAIKPDIIHTNVFHTVTNVWRALAKSGIPIVHSLREYKLMCPFNMFRNGVDCGLSQCLECDRASSDAREASSLVSGVVGISRFTLDRHIGAGFFDGAKQAVIPNSFKPAGHPVGRSQFTTPGARPTFGFFGRLHESKGILSLLDAVMAMPANTVTLKLAGDVQDEHVRHRIEAASAVQDVQFLGFAQPREFFEQIDILVVPSLWHEPFGRVAIEALAHGVPIVSSRRGGLIDIVDEGINGWLYEPDEKDGLLTQLSRAHAITTETWAEFSENAIASSKQYLPSDVAASYLEFYRQVIGDGLGQREKSLLSLYTRTVAKEGGLEAAMLKRGTRNTRPLEVAIVTGEFPKRSETFVLNHVTGLLDLGIKVRIIQTRNVSDYFPPEYSSYKLAGIIHELHPQDPIAERIEAARHSERRHAAAALNKLDLKGSPALKLAVEIVNNAGARRRAEAGARRLAELTQGADIIHCHFGHRALEVLHLQQLAGLKTPVVCTFHGIDVSAHLKAFGKERYAPIIGQLTKALPVSHFFADRLCSLGFDRKDVQVHRVGVDLTRFEYAERVRGNDEPLRLLSIGRLVEKKGFKYSLMAVAQLMSERPDLAIEYSIIGDGEDFGLMQDLIVEAGMTEKIKLMGSRTHQEVAEALAASHALIVPSVTAEGGDQEGVPTVAMEAAASGLPVLATRHSGLPEVVLHDRTGLLSDEKDIEGMMRNILYLHENPELGRSMGWAGRVHVEHEFNIRRQNRKIVDLYEDIAAGRTL